MGFETNNALFEQNSGYFLNALVRANYQNLDKGIKRTMEYLNLFFGNLLLGENNVLDSRIMQIKENSTQKTKVSTQKITDILRENPKITRAKLANILNSTPDSVKWHLDKLKKSNKIRSIGPDKGGFWQVLD